MRSTLCAILASLVCSTAFGADSVIRVGIIGVDTSHAIAFTNILNAPAKPAASNAKAPAKPALDAAALEAMSGVKIVAAYPAGTRDNPSSWDRIPKHTEELRDKGIKIVDSVEALLPLVDAVLLESVDGRPHLEQARPVIAAHKPLFIDKPMAASLVDVLVIFRLAKEAGTPCFSSSSLRFGSEVQAVRNKTSPLGDVRRCTASSPMSTEPHHPDLFWYGIHGVEMLYTIMGTGCKTVKREAQDRVVGVWADGREGIFQAQKGYGAEIEGAKQSGKTGKYEGYAPLVVEFCKFFKTGKAPVAAEETIEIFAFMEAADESKRQGGAPVSIESVLAKARAEAAKKIQ